MRRSGLDKIFLVSIGIGFLVICFIVLVLTLSDLMTEYKLDHEIDKIQTIINQDKMDEKELNKLLNREIMKGSYQKVEKAYKENVGNIISKVKDIDEFNNSIDLINAFKSENLENDGPDFEETKKRIEDYKKKYEEKNKELIKIREDETLWSYLPEKKSSKYNKQYIKENIKKVFRTKYLRNILDNFSKTKKILDQAEKMIDFLVKNKEDWQVKEDNAEFKTDSLEDEYQKLLKKWEELIKKKEVKTGE